MSVLQLQTAMAKLLTCPEFRERARQDGGAALRAYDLTEREVRELLALLEGRLGLYAASVSVGKEDFLVSNLPALVRERVPDAELRPAVRRFIEARPETMLHPRDAGLVVLLRFLEDDLPSAADVLRFERIRRQVMASKARYPPAPGTRVPERLERHGGWDAERFSLDGDVCWMFKRDLAGSAEHIACHPVLVDVARAFDHPAEVEAVVAQLAAKHRADDRLGPDHATAVRELTAELFAEGSLRTV